MISTYFFFFIALNLLPYSRSLQSGYTCETPVTITCSSSRKIVILEVTYSSECPKVNDESNGTSTYPPSRCVGRSRERASTACNGQQSCMIDNDIEQRPEFVNGIQANCDFKGQSINIEYLCIPDFYSSKLPRIDICSLQALEDIKEGFIHTPNYPENYPNDRTCIKTVPAPDADHRLKIYALDFDVESATAVRPLNTIKLNDWLEVNGNEEKLYGTRAPYTLLFDDVIEASLKFQSNSANTKRSYNGFVLYFVVTPVRRTRPPATTKIMTTINVESSSTEYSPAIIREKVSALYIDNRRTNNTGLILLVVLLSGILLVVLCAFLLYRRRNDRRIRYFTETFNSFLSKRSKPVTLQSSETSEENDLHSKFDLSSTNTDEKFNDKHMYLQSQGNSDHIYSEDPLEKKTSSALHDDNSIIYEYIDVDTVNHQLVKPKQNIV